ncbi:MAG TPA: filamentous hemagglutinin N-terminal domain-containing protein [Verrucomicrobiae bacterium]|nr:filamentous hemagglutinin N-terminal domain-containing protein [Verrucomicrobiae bacterium]
MKGNNLKRRCCLPFSIILAAQIAWLAAGQAQIVRDNTLDNHKGESLAGPNFDITADYGRIIGNNLFHSFSQFDLVNGDVATFSGPANIHNILSRITGPNASSIDGTIRSTIDGANLFFLNPHGVIFGQHAQVDVKGSFLVTSAHYIELSDGHRFDTVNPSANDPLLTSASPSAFGFLGPTVAPISFNGCSLSVPDLKSLSVIAGDVQIVNGQLQAAGGRINVISVGSAGSVSLDVDNPNAVVDTSAFTTLGTVSLNNSALLGNDGVSVGGGRVVVHAQDLTFDNSGIDATVMGAEDGQGVEVQVRDSMTLQNLGYIFSDTSPFSTGNGGNIDIQTHQLQLLHGSAITCDVHGTGHGGSISVTADSVVLDGMYSPTYFAGIGARTDSSGNAGDVQIGTDTLDIRNGTIVSTVSAGSGHAGNTTVSASAINIDGHGMTSGIIADTTTGGGDAGDVTVATVSLEISDGGRISSATGGSGNGGSVAVTATDSIVLDGEEGTLFTGIGVPPLAAATGNGGDLAIRTASLEVLNGARILAGTQGAGAGGNINITAGDVLLDGGDATFLTGIEAQTSGDGNAGGINLQADSLRMINGAQIDADTSSPGAGGAIEINAGHVEINTSAAISAGSDGQGQGGKITLAADSIVVDGLRADGSVGFAGIFSGNFFGVQGNARAGDITIRPGNSGALSLQLLNGAQISASTKGASDGGSIAIDATDVTLKNHSSIQCSTVGTGEAGDITLTAHGTLRVEDNSDISVPAASHDGGNITLAVGKLAYLFNSSFSASAGDNGGNIRIAPNTLVLNHGVITADAVNNNGGNITIGAKQSIQLKNHSELTASALHGNGGEIIANAGTELRLSDSEISATAAHDGGNITLQAPNLIYALNGKISASADDNGGNITVDPVFLVMNQSAISADAVNNNGGRIRILADYFLRTDTPITADSEFGNPGTVLIEATELDLSGSLVSLPGSLLGAESQLRQWCGARLAGGVSSFLVLGRGGVSVEPDGPLPSFETGSSGGVTR